VQRAIDQALATAKKTNDPVYTHGPLIHNRQVIDELKKRNITSVEGELERARNGTLIIRAHGIRPDELSRIKSSQSRVVDATCPLVMKVHKKIRKYQDEGYRIYIMGEATHPEVLGLIGAANDEALIVPPDPSRIDEIPVTDERVCLVSQTTQNDQIFAEVARKLEGRCRELLAVNTICNPTRSHQQETLEIASTVDLVVVVGGKHSANTRHLADLARTVCSRVIHIETDAELSPSIIEGVESVGVTAGASTPQWMIRRVVDRLEELSGGAGWIKRLFRSFIGLVIPTNIYSSMAFASLYAGLSIVSGFPIHKLAFLSALLVVFGIHSINEYSEDVGFDRRSRFSPVIYERFRKGMLSLAFLSVSIGVYLGLVLTETERVHPFVPIALFLIASGGVVYGRKLVPAFLIQKMGFRSIKDLPGSKDLSVSLGWTLLIAFVPLFSGGGICSYSYLMSVLYVFVVVFRRSAVMALQEVQGDRIVGMESSFKFLGKAVARRLHRVLDALALLFPVILFFMIDAPFAVSFPVLLSAAIGFVISVLYHFRRLPQGLTGQFLIDTQFVLPGFIGCWLNSPLVLAILAWKTL